MGNLRQIEETRWGLSELTENKQKAIRQRYGDWENLSDDGLLEWMKVIDTDYEEGKFNLDDY